jgi:hypothetical protein
MWRAILDALTSKPVARLEKVWRKVDTADRLNVESWVKGENGVKKSSQNPIPWLVLPAKELAREAQALKVGSNHHQKRFADLFCRRNLHFKSHPCNVFTIPFNLSYPCCTLVVSMGSS